MFSLDIVWKVGGRSVGSLHIIFQTVIHWATHIKCVFRYVFKDVVTHESRKESINHD